MKLFDLSFLTDHTSDEIAILVISLFIGVFIASLAALYNKRVLGDIVRKLIKAKAFSVATALTVSEMGYSSKNPLILFALRNKSTFTKTVHRTKEDSQTRYYIPEEIHAREEIKYRKQGTNITTVILTVIVFVTIGIAAINFIPWILEQSANKFN